MNKTINKQKLVIIHPLEKGEFPKPDFWILLAFLKRNFIDYQLIMSEITDDFSLAADRNILYIHIADIIFLHKLNNLLPQCKGKNCLLIAGGALPLSIESEKILNTFQFINIIARAPENEKVLAKLIKTIFNNGNWQNIKGITYRCPHCENKIIANKSQTLSKNINHLSNLGIYNQHFQYALPYQWYPILVSRGCDGNCMYCGFQEPYKFAYVNGTSYWRKKSEKLVADELEFLLAKGISKFIFTCNRFFGSQKSHSLSSINIAKEILNRKLKLKFKLIALAGDLKKNLEHLLILKEAGLDEIMVGIDSGIPRFHEMYHTGSTVEDCIKVLQFLHEYHFKFNISYIFYDPYLTIKEINETFVFLKRVSEYFYHLEIPFSAILDSKVLNSTLILRFGMPIIQKLKDDGLLIEYPDYSVQPGSIFKDSAVKNIYHIYRQVNQAIIPKIRHLFYDKELVTSFAEIDLFPLMLIEKIVYLVEKEKVEDLGRTIAEIEIFTKNFIGGFIDKLFDVFPRYRNSVLYSWLKQ